LLPFCRLFAKPDAVDAFADGDRCAPLLMPLTPLLEKLMPDAVVTRPRFHRRPGCRR